MQLKKIKLAGFKSFVDPTTITLPSQLIGVVGPNGCGKSNVIDAVRWVLGESSAKNLRGTSLEDVIFNGSSARKSVGHATIELIFDNTDGSLGGQYAQYNEIAIKRRLTRDGQSTYYLNGTRCRRRDITDIFLGTGLGPRSYAIIEQGTVSRLIEAKPEELRVFLEEAAGISKYKERRRETENRIRSTKDNISRLNDLLGELEKRLATLQRQARTAEKYKVVKEEERLVKAQLLALRWRALDGELEEQNRTIASRETALEARLADLRAVEAEVEKQRERHGELNATFNQVQEQYYAVGAEIARVEQAIQHATEKLHQNQRDLEDVERTWRESQAHIDDDARRIETLTRALEESEPELEAARKAEEVSTAALAEAEQNMQIWQNEWDTFNTRAAAQIQAAEVERTRIHHLEDHLMQLRERQERLGEEQGLLDTAADEETLAALEREEQSLSRRVDEHQAGLQSLIDQLARQREENQRLAERLEAMRRRHQDVQKRHAALDALQKVALGKETETLNGWLRQHDLADADRLAQHLQVEPGWEQAVETVLGSCLEAVCVDDLDALAAQVGSLESGALTAFDTAARGESQDSGLATPLLSRITAPWDLSTVLGGVHAVDSLDEALALRPRLGAKQSLVTRDGVWIGRGWLRVARAADAEGGVLKREQRLKAITRELAEVEDELAGLERREQAGREHGRALEEQREAAQQRATESSRQHADLQARIGSLRARLEQVRANRQRIADEIAEIAARVDTDKQELSAARERLQQVMAETEHHEPQREALLSRRDELRRTLESCREQARNDRDRAREIAMRRESMSAQLQSLRVSHDRLSKQLANLSRQRDDLMRTLENGDEPILRMKQELEEKLEARLGIETALSEARRAVEACDHALRELNDRHNTIGQELQNMQAALESLRLARQEYQVRRQTLQEQLAETSHELSTLLDEMPGEATEAAWQEKLDQLGARIQRMGAINLAAIDEYNEQSERKVYLDAQLADLNEALDTLESAIRKIDNETRTRFKETYERVNERLQEFYPRLFGGGVARLDMTSDDLLEAGIQITAQPPGKRPGSIHLLSGGEKALTAIALVFALFELNPAPFCMLDEVDAPLDDNNAIRFCQLVKEMSERVQFIVISHNKITMEMAQQLIGVTMHEPGVSRLVAVDVDEAVEMVTA